MWSLVIVGIILLLIDTLSDAIDENERLTKLNKDNEEHNNG